MTQNALLDLLQGASNAAASNLSVPVDGIAWLLRKAGVPVNNPVGGSDWMAQRGLIAEPKNKTLGLLGESLGSVAPIISTAKAPNIANGLLRMMENASSPQTLSRQAGVIEFPPTFTRLQRSDAIKSIADNFADAARNKGLSASIEHSGSAAGPSSYVSISDPITGAKFENPFRFSDHSKGAFNSQFINEARGAYGEGIDANLLNALDSMASSIPKNERDAIQSARLIDALRRKAAIDADRVFVTGRNMYSKALQDAKGSGAEFTKAFSNSGKYIGPN
jgi:hypothetical protein